jgi:hypothetical protein
MMSNLIIFACFCRISFLHAFVPSATYVIDSYSTTSTANAISSRSSLLSSPFDDLIGGLFGNHDEKEKKSKSVEDSITNSKGADDEDDVMSLSSFQEELAKRQQVEETQPNEDEDDFNGYDLRDIIYAKYGECFDVQFQRVDSYGVRAVYLVSFCILLGRAIYLLFAMGFSLRYCKPNICSMSEHNAI